MAGQGPRPSVFRHPGPVGRHGCVLRLGVHLAVHRDRRAV